MSPSAAAEPFERERPRLLGLAYRMTGSVGDAEDVVQEAWLRWSGTDQAAVERPAAWLTTVTTRLALDRIKAIERRREDYVGPWLPEPVMIAGSPEADVELAESLTLGFLVLLDRLGPTERAVFLLADVFGEPFAAVAAAVGKTPQACRQIASRARRRLRDGAEPARPLKLGDPLLTALITALGQGDIDAVLSLLDADVVHVSDGGPGRHAARRPVVGAEKVARLLVNLAQRMGEADMRFVELNGAAALVTADAHGPVVVQAEARGNRISAIWAMANPDKLGHIGARTHLR
ncbi:MAG: RNA polymerase sigma factor SigJ [Acidimicrobiia bacterium]